MTANPVQMTEQPIAPGTVSAGAVHTPHCTMTLKALGCWNPEFCRIYATQRTAGVDYEAALLGGDDAEIHHTRRRYDAASAALLGYRRGVPIAPVTTEPQP